MQGDQTEGKVFSQVDSSVAPTGLPRIARGFQRLERRLTLGAPEPPRQRVLMLRGFSPRQGRWLIARGFQPLDTFAFRTQGLEAPGYFPVPLWGREQMALTTVICALERSAAIAGATGVDWRNLTNDPNFEQVAEFPLLAWRLEVVAENAGESRLDKRGWN